ncbi:FAD-binding protein [Qipengyuania marisflavi]|uniref:FAD-binding protein n=1 Tax=Qipengyuania marisflavi TaxID=2486356 RepID=A0A5S3PBD9_9SPHN|nr:FAD-binding protein [Qipengyuania marisflavi]TMM50075.1 FAD-binding protein [Qipengyuania marisflavi]
MLKSVERALRNRKVAKGEGKAGLRRIYSWMHVFRGDAEACIPATEAELASKVREGGFSCIGKAHSYNGVQVVPRVNAMMMREGGLTTLAYDPQSHIATVGASVSIEELKRFLLTKDRRMLNSGNYMQQTVIGALLTGTHGYGAEPVMAHGLVSLTFLDGDGLRVRLTRNDPDFRYVALSFGVIAPIIEVELRTAPLEAFESVAHITRLSKKRLLQNGAVASSWAAVPYSSAADPMIMLHTLTPCEEAERLPDYKSRIFSGGWLAEVFLKHYWAFDRFFPSARRKMQHFVDRLDITKRQSVITDPHDLDYLYDPQPGLMNERGPDVLRGVFSTTHTAYNLAFHVPLDRAEAVVKFIMLEVEGLRDLGFYLKSLIGVRELEGSSHLPFAANFKGPVAAIDLFADPRDYAWLERIQRQVMQYEPDTRPHFGKSALVPGFRAALGEDELARLFAIHCKHYPQQRLIFNESVRGLLDVGRPTAGNAVAEAALAV